MKKNKLPNATRIAEAENAIISYPASGISSFSNYHFPVLYKEVVEGLQIKPNGIYVDCTFGGGGHSKGILERLNKNGRLIAFDQDKDAKKNLLNDKRFVFVPHNFRHLQKFLRMHNFLKVDGILADLGVSSHQFNEAERGFSTRFNGPIDMRMNQLQQKTAADILFEYSEEDLNRIFEQYGEIRNTKTLVKHIIQHRAKQPLKTIDELRSLVAPVVKGNSHKYLAQLFQALRIEVNDEVNALKEMLQQTIEVLKTGGRIAVISFHSLEDRIVKHFFKTGCFKNQEAFYNPFSNEIKKHFRLITLKPIMATKKETENNKRSRSAKLRIAEKI